MANFTEKWLKMHRNLGVQITNKCHMIMDHFEEYIRRNNRPIGYISDEVIEAAHAMMNKRMTRSDIYT